MEKHFSLSDSAFEKQFADQTLDPALFSHEAHIRLAWIHISKYGIDAAIVNITQQIRAFAAHHGDHDKYNETVTVAALRAVYHFMLRSGESSFQEFILAHPRLKYNFRELMNAHYRTDIFKNPAAKIQYLEPELLPFD